MGFSTKKGYKGVLYRVLRFQFGEKMRKHSGMLTALVELEIWSKSDSDIIKAFEKFLLNFKEPDDTLEVFYALIDLGKNKFAKILEKLGFILAPRVIVLQDRLKTLLLYMSQSCRECFVFFVRTFKDEIIASLSEQHFNDIITLILNIALINEDLAVFFAGVIQNPIFTQAKTEGIKHFGTVLWYMVVLNKKKLAQKLILILRNLIIKKAHRLSDYGDIILWLGKGDSAMGLYVFDVFKKHIVDKINSASISDLITFVVQVSKTGRTGRIIFDKTARFLQRRISQIKTDQQSGAVLEKLNTRYNNILRLIVR